jgi:uncharacterized repeat protein (TIGR03806 family)
VVASAQGLDVRPPSVSCVAPPRPTAGAFRVGLAPLFPAAQLVQALSLVPSPLDENVWYVAERIGDVERIRTDVAQQTRVLNIRPRVLGTGEGGLLGLALHPDFASNGALYVYYTRIGRAPGVPIEGVLARYTSSNGGMTFAPASETVILVVPYPSSTHVSGAIHFGVDGLLYIAVGDGNDATEGQDPTSMPGSFLRIDVDAAVPYAIPPGNPFAQGGAGLPEIFAWGFRNPYRFGMDPLTGDVWAGDVGQAAWEELDRVQAGLNYGWPIREASYCYGTSQGCSSAGLTDPDLEYSHESGCAIIGGPVYRGAQLPELDGAVVFGDFCSARIWAALPDGAGGYERADLLTAPAGILGFGQGGDGEVVVTLYSGVFRLVPLSGPEPPPFPDRLSETGCFEPANPTQATAGMIPFDVNEPLWSDGADKKRWLALPPGGRILVGDGDFELPIGSVLAKEFRLGDVRVETRLFVRHEDGGWAGYSYAWDAAQTDALLLYGSEQRTFPTGVWTYPSREQCMSCHTFGAGYTLGLELAQLNRHHYYPQTGRTANQLETFEHIGLFVNPLPAPVGQLPFLSRESLNDAARSYLHTNCSVCHRFRGPVHSMDLRVTSTVSQLEACNVYPSFGTLGVPGAHVLVPGDPSRSLVSIRAHLVGGEQMPPVARAVVDAYGTQVIDDWISSWPSCAGPDSDGDGVVDSADNCRTVANAAQPDADGDLIGDACEWVCNDGVDNDGDGLRDYPADPGCASRTAETERTECDDGLDNDGDGRLDSPFDVGCQTPSDPVERASCSDGLDNDRDGRVDFDGGVWATGSALGLAEAACHDAPWQDSEAPRPPSCGIGPELALLAFGLRALLRRRAPTPSSRCGRRPGCSPVADRLGRHRSHSG